VSQDPFYVRIVKVLIFGCFHLLLPHGFTRILKKQPVSGLKPRAHFAGKFRVEHRAENQVVKLPQNGKTNPYRFVTDWEERDNFKRHH
jgi:hypothetical protein